MFIYIQTKQFTNLTHPPRIQTEHYLLLRNQYVSFVMFSCLKLSSLDDSVALTARQSVPTN